MLIMVSRGVRPEMAHGKAQDYRGVYLARSPFANINVSSFLT